MRHIPIYINPERHPEPEPGEWETDELGRRFRRIGKGAIEYEPEINGIPQSVFFRSQKAQKEQREKQLKEEQARAAEKAARRRNCPFIDSNSRNTDCTLEACALYMDGCTLARLTPAKDTEGLQCPFSRYRHKCRKDCALYKGGCTLTGITTTTESEDK